MVTVAVDGMGHDDGPAAIVPGVKDAAAEGVRVLLCGAREQLEAELGGSVEGVEIVDAGDVIESSDEPAAAVRAKPGSSMVTACRLVRDGSAEAVVSGGPTGAMLAASLLHVGRIRGISRPGIGVPLPAQGAPCLLIDSGANSDARAENLLQFGIMGSQFMRDVMGIEEPGVGLLSIGEEPSKGNAVTVEAHQLLAAADLNFAGNCEGRDVLSGRFQVVVADGFAGNVLLKGLEGAAAALLGEVRRAAESSTRAKIGGLLLRPALRAMRDRTEPDNYRWRVPARPARGGRDRPRQLRPQGRSQRDPDRRQGRRRRGRGPDGGAARGRSPHFRLAGACGDQYSPAGYGPGDWRPVTINREEALERVRGILVEQLGVDEEQVTDDASFQGDLDADSLDLVELIMELEDQFGLKISDEDAQKIATVGEAVDYVVSHS